MYNCNDAEGQTFKQHINFYKDFIGKAHEVNLLIE